MKRVIYLIAIASLIQFVQACERASVPKVPDENDSAISQEVYGRYYAPTIYVNGQEQETMLTTVFGALDINKSDNGTVAMALQYKGLDIQVGYGIYYITDFQVNLPGVPCENNGPLASLNGNDIEGRLDYSYVMHNGSKGNGSITRRFHIEGSVDKTDRSKSTVTISAVIIDKAISISLSQVTPNEADAEFGIMGYPSWNAELIHAMRTFINNTEHSFTVEHQVASMRSENLGTISPGTSGKVFLLDEDDCPIASYILTFDDGRVSRHAFEDTHFSYAGLPVEVIDKPFLSFNSGQISYDINYVCTYTVTPEVYENAE